MHLTFPCKRCGGAVTPGAQAQLLQTLAAVALDCACANCGHRALYRPNEQASAVAATR